MMMMIPSKKPGNQRGRTRPLVSFASSGRVKGLMVIVWSMPHIKAALGMTRGASRRSLNPSMASLSDILRGECRYLAFKVSLLL